MSTAKWQNIAGSKKSLVYCLSSFSLQLPESQSTTRFSQKCDKLEIQIHFQSFIIFLIIGIATAA